MKLLAYAVFDKKTAAYHQPFFVSHEAHAIRSVSAAVNEKGNTLNQYPSDYTLNFVGSFTDHDGMFVPSIPVHVLEVVSLVKLHADLPLFDEQEKA